MSNRDAFTPKYIENLERWKANKMKKDNSPPGKRGLYAMKKDELVEHCWSLTKRYNELRSICDYQERLLVLTREQAGIIRTGIGEQIG